MTDGVYITLDDLKRYGIGSIADPNNPTIYNGNVSGSPDDQVLSDCILRAEMEFNTNCGSGYDEQPYTLVPAFQTFVDGNGWLHLWARERGPVTAVSAIEIRYVLARTAWQTLTFTADNIILPPFETQYPHPESWHVQLYPDQSLPPIATGHLITKWSYTGGYHTIPTSLKNTICRLAWWIYKLREAPIGTVIDLQSKTMTVPLSIPKDILADIQNWKPQYS